jgi:hypothetical protein
MPPVLWHWHACLFSHNVIYLINLFMNNDQRLTSQLGDTHKTQHVFSLPQALSIHSIHGLLLEASSLSMCRLKSSCLYV